MKRKILLLLFLISISNIRQSIAQDIFGGVNLNLLTGYTSAGSFKKFIDSYNSILESDLKNKLNRTAFVSGYVVGVEVNALLYGAINYMKLKGDFSATLNDGSKRVFKLEQSIWNVPIGFGRYESDGAYFSAGLGIGISNMIMSTFTKYVDGTVSMGNEKILNGTYNTSTFFLSPEVQIGVSAGNSVISLLLSYHFNTLSSGNVDFFNIDRERISGIPEDYNNFLNNPNFGFVDDPVKFNFNGLVIGLGLKYNLLSLFK
ncbi:MAG TPA: hypothetical protein P5050_08060 [Bacteroidia bacterium]|nr:hypothetical protein [Bacteroidia bacterium]HRS59159.1 hypothetical protein [Bacteroidia bacterium]HRU67455.1 hypothetical protein [Bacteroidia bacterium]